jgi:hypothetical protein
MFVFTDNATPNTGTLQGPLKNALKSSRAISRVNVKLKTNVSDKSLKRWFLIQR